MSLREFFTLSAAFCFICAIGWFVSFSLDPYRVCIDHPDKSKSDELFLCKPFDFELHKDTLLRREKQMPWEGDGTFFDSSDRRKKHKKNVEMTPVEKCIRDVKLQDPENRLGIDRQKHCENLLEERSDRQKGGANDFIENKQRAPTNPEGSQEL